MRKTLTIPGSILLLLCGIVASPAAQQDPAELGTRLLRQGPVRAAVDFARSDEARTIAEQIEICEVPAPPFQEQVRAALYARKFRELGLQNVRIDAEGNVLGERPGRAAAPHLVFSAHLDTVFPEGTDVTVTRSGPVLAGPGIGDDCRGLAVVLAVVRALDAGKVETPGPITFVGTVGEEGLGDLRGVKYLFYEGLKDRIDRFVSVDGSGLGISHVAVGSLRYRVTVRGPGGHSYGAFGLANPIHALGRVIAAMADFDVPREPKTTFNVGRIGGGTSVNSIAAEAWAEVDMRSADPDALGALHARFHEAVDRAVAAEDARSTPRGLTVEKRLVGDRPAGRSDADSPIVLAARSTNSALDLPVYLDEGSTDSNIAMSLGIPAITIDAGGLGQAAHSLDETFDTTESWKGTQRAVLLAIALTQP